VAGHGAMGIVHRGRWRDMAVAVKVIEGAWQASEETQAELDREAKVMMAVRHPNIVMFLGAGVMANGSPFLVTEFMELGSLRRVLETRELRWDLKIRIASDVARGMALVHSLGRMHRDLKADNILLTSDMRAKIADFGTAGLLTMAVLPADRPVEPAATADARTRTKGLGTPLWMAPEVLAGRAYDARVDVYSYGIVLWEIASQRLPWEDVHGSFLLSALLTAIEAGQRPPVDGTWPRGYCAVMERCWQLGPSDRPDFETVGRMLRSLAS
jgi:LRR receptor-like serine/threonine-protein kinase FLS2